MKSAEFLKESWSPGIQEIQSQTKISDEMIQFVLNEKHLPIDRDEQMYLEGILKE